MFLLPFLFFFRGLSAPEAEMLYMQELEKMEGYGQESYQAKVGLRDVGLLESELVNCT